MNDKPEGVVWRRYTIHPGDTVWAIAQKFEVSSLELVKINNMANPDRIEAGETILIPLTVMRSNGENTVVG
jgi:LysM repeat protein